MFLRLLFRHELIKFEVELVSPLGCLDRLAHSTSILLDGVSMQLELLLALLVHREDFLLKLLFRGRMLVELQVERTSRGLHPRLPLVDATFHRGRIPVPVGPKRGVDDVLTSLVVIVVLDGEVLY